MNVTVKTNTGTIINPSFDPGQGQVVVDFYKNQFHSYQIEAYKIVNNAGVVVAEEGIL